MSFEYSKLNLAEILLFSSHDASTPLYHYNDKAVSRHDLQVHVKELASVFESMLEPGDHIVLCLNDSPSLVAAFLSCIAIGVIPTVVNPKSTNFTLDGIVNNCQPKFIITDFIKGCTLPHWDDVELIIANDLDCEVLSHFNLDKGTSEWNSFYQQAPDDTCYLQYTSGSTGEPKGVMHTALGTLNFCQTMTKDFLCLTAEDICYSIPKIFFGYGMGNSIFFPLYSGCSAIIDSEWPSLDKILQNLKTYKPNVLYAAPAIYQLLKAHDDVLTQSVKVAVSAGASLQAEEFQFWKSKNIEVCDGIGATEVGHIFLGNKPTEAIPGTTGRVLPPYECRLIDQDNNDIITADTQGVLLVKGPSVSQGYLKQLDKTESSFIDGWYRTGDLFTFDKDGNYYYRGREDDMFKIKGRWVTPSYIEQGISRAFPNVVESALVPSHRTKDTIKPTLFIVADNDLIAQVHNFVINNFESHMQPHSVINLTALPRNDNGKVVRSKLIDQAILGLKKEAECV